MDEQIYYSKQLAKTLIGAAAAAVVGGLLIVSTMGGHSLGSMVLMGLIFAGLPSGWAVISQALGRWVVFNLQGMILLLAVKALVACLIGAVALPVRVGYCIVKCGAACREELAYAA